MLFEVLSMYEQVMHDTSSHWFESSVSRLCYESKVLN